MKTLTNKSFSKIDGASKPIYKKDEQVFKKQVVLIDDNEINTTADPKKEFLLTAAEETMHTRQTFLEIPAGGKLKSQKQYQDLEHEKQIQPILKAIGDEYDAKKK